MTRMKYSATFLLVAFALSACSSGTKTLPAVPAATNPVSPSKKLADASFVIHWVAPHPLTHARRRPQFIAPNAQSLVIEVNNDPTLTTITPRSGASTSTVSFKAPPGSDTIVFSIWDGMNGNGNELGSATIMATIATGSANTVSATIDGIVSSIKAVPLPNQPQLQATTSAAGTTTFAILGDLPQTFAITALDPDGNAIVIGSNPITYTVKETSSFFTTSQVGANGQFTVQVLQENPDPLPAALTISALDGQGDVAQSNYSIQTNEFMLVGYTNSGTGSIVAMTTSG